MIILEVAGGLGNQLQQYALYRKLCTLGADVRLDLSWFSKDNQERTAYKRSLTLDRLTGISYRACTEKERRHIYGSDSFAGKLSRRAGAVFGGHSTLFTESQIFHPELLDRITAHPEEDLYLRGFWACETYYAELLPVFRSEIGFPVLTDPRLSAAEREAVLRLSEEIGAAEAVSLHLRRGDYLDAQNQALFGGICTEEYYRSAVRFVLTRLTERGVLPEHVVFYVFSDDPGYASEFAAELFASLWTEADDTSANFSDINYRVVDAVRDENSLYDLCLMSRCRHNICANSTFSFWGARLNGNPEKIMVRPEKHKNTQPFDPEEMSKLWPGWNFISSGCRGRFS